MTVAEITNEIHANYEQIKQTEAKIKSISTSLCELFEVARAEHRSLFAETDETRSKRDELHRADDALKNELKLLNVKRRVLISNRKAAMYNEIVPVIIEEFNRYKNKPYGEKTKEKIAVAIQQRTGFRAFIDTSWSWSRYDAFDVYGEENITFYLKPDYTALKENKITELTPDMFRDNCGYKIVDADWTATETLKRIDECKKAYEEYLKVEARLNEISPVHVSATAPDFHKITR